MRIPREELQADIAKRFPRDVDKQLVTFRALDPQVDFPGTPDVLGVRVRLEATSASGNSHIAGTARAEGRIEYVASEHAFYLRDSRVTDLVLDPAEGHGGLSRAVNRATSTLGTELMQRVAMSAVEELLRKHPVYRLDPSRDRDARAIRHLRGVHVRGQELVLEVGL